MSLECLLEAAKILEQRENGTSTVYGSPAARKERKVTRRSQSYRATHNQLEKNRRAHLRDCLVSLRELVPTPPDQAKATTLSLLQSAKQYIKVLEMHDREAVKIKKNLFEEQERLQKRLSEIVSGKDSHEYEVPTKIAKIDTYEEIDVENDDETGYSSGDDRSSMGSSGSNGGHV